MNNTNLYLDLYGLHYYNEKLKKYVDDKKVKTDNVTIGKNTSGELEVTERFIQGLKDYISENYASNTKVSQIISRLNTLIGADEEGHKIDVTSIIDTFNEIKDFLANIEDTTLIELFDLVNTRISNTLLLVGIDDIPEFDSTKNYSTNDLVIYSDKLYKFIETHSAGAWIGTDTLETDLIKEIDQTLTETYNLVESINNALAALSPDQQEALGVAAKANANEAKLGYYVCGTDAAVAAKTIAATGYALTKGGNIRIKMTNDNTADSATLNINSTGAKALFYNGTQASSTNSWEAGEVLEVYYDGTQYQCASGGGGKFATGENVPDISIEHTLSEDNDALPTGKAVSDALRETAAAVIEEIGDHITIEGNVINNPDNEDITSQEVSGVNVLKFKDKLHAPANYSGLGRKYLRKNVHTVEAVTRVNRTEITIPNSFTYLIDLDNHTCDYTNNSNKFTTRNIGWHGDVQAGDTFEILGSSMTAAYSELYPRWRLWVMVDPVSKEILQDEHGNYLMADAAVNHEGDGVVITAPRACHLIVGFWTGLSSGGVHRLNRITTESVQREVNLFDSSLCAEQNTQYIVQYDYDLNGGKITLPKGSVLKFEGGTIGNGSAFNATILGDDATIDANLTQVFSPNVTLSGTWRNETFHPEWFGAKGDGVTDDTQALQAALNLGNSISVPLNITVKLNKTYLFTDTLIIYANTTLYGNAIMSSGNSFKGYTLHAVFSDPHKCAIMSSNMAALPYNAGASRGQIDGGTIKYCDGIHIHNVVLQGDKVEYVRDGETIQMPIFCGIKITASSLSSIKDSCIRGFWYGVARFATWYSSDEDVFISAYKCGYYAGYDMNNFSIRNGYINADNNTGIEITSAEKFNSDPSTYSYGVLAVYACGGLYNVISEAADYGRWYCAHSYIVDIHSWMEAIKNYCYGVYGGARVTIIEGMFISANFLASYDSTHVKLIGMKPPGAVSIGKYDTFEVDFAGSKSSGSIYKGISGRCGTSVYDPGLKKRLWWSPNNFYGGSDGYNLQSVFSGTAEEAPTDFNLKDGSVFMKTESNGTVRPVFQKTAGSRCIVRLSVSTLPSSNGKVQVKFFNYVLNINVTTESTAESILNVVNDAIFASIKDANNVKISDMYAVFDRGNLHLYNNVAGIHTTDEFGFTDTDNTGTSMKFTYTSMGTMPEFVDAMGMGISTELSSSVLPATAPDGASLLWNGMMVYRSNGGWYDFDGNKISYDFRLTSGNVDNTVANGGASVTFQILSTYKNIADNVIVVDDYETNSTLQNNGSGQFTLTVQVAANKLTSERTQSVTLTQLSSNVEITLTFTQEAAASASNILILDSAFKAELVSRYDKNNDGEISYDDAIVPTAPAANSQFASKGITDIDIFNYFANIKEIKYTAFGRNPIEHFHAKNITKLTRSAQFAGSDIQYAYFPKAEYTDYGTLSVYYGQFNSCTHLIGVRYDKIAVLGDEFYGSSIQFLIVLSPLVIKIGTTANLPAKIYVRDSLVDKYKNADVWYGIADRILPISQFLNDFPNTPSFMTKGLSSYYIETPTISTSGFFADRPTTGINDGFVYFATDLGTNGKPIWYTGSTWVDATGEEISI